MKKGKITSTPVTVPTANEVLPPGLVFPFAGDTAPSGFLMCYGQAISRSTYANLFIMIGTTYGVGDGSTTFNLPDLRGRAVAGKDDMGGAAANRLTAAGSGVNGINLGAAGGSQTHTLTGAESGQKAGTYTSGNNNQSLTHLHTVGYTGNLGYSGGGGNANTAWGPGANQMTNASGDLPHTHSTSIPASNATNAHNNTQPTLVLNYIIKY